MTHKKSLLRKCRKMLCALLCTVICVACLAGCNRKSKTDCEHDYYLSDYSAPTADSNGYSVYTCKKCEALYKEIIPATGSNAQPEVQSGGYSKDSKTIKLFDLPTYSYDHDIFDTLNYESNVVDYDGKHHKDCYRLRADGKKWKSRFIEYELNGEYTKIRGEIFSYRSDPGVVWLEFYDGDKFLFSTSKLSKDNTSAKFEFDLSGVNNLIVYPIHEDVYGSYEYYIIADQIAITK